MLSCPIHSSWNRHRISHHVQTRTINHPIPSHQRFQAVLVKSSHSARFAILAQYMKALKGLCLFVKLQSNLLLISAYKSFHFQSMVQFKKQKMPLCLKMRTWVSFFLLVLHSEENIYSLQSPSLSSNLHDHYSLNYSILQLNVFILFV